MKSNKTEQITPPPKQNKSFFYILLGLFIFMVFSVGAVVLVISKVVGRTTGAPLLSSSDEITLIEIEGPIYQSDDVVRRIKHFRKSNKKVLLLRLNSPGGAVAPSQEIYTEVLRAREDKKIVIASMGSLAASGAYYIAIAANKIVANPGTVTGSIGVIAEFPDASSLMNKVGLKFQTVKSGKFKDTGSMDRPLTPQEKVYLQETIDDVFGQFVDSVLSSRKGVLQEKLALLLNKKPSEITNEQIRKFILQYADGRILTGKKAYELGFIDKLGNYYDAVNLAADMAGIKGEPTVRLDQPMKFDQFLNNILPFSLFSKATKNFELNYRVF